MDRRFTFKETESSGHATALKVNGPLVVTMTCTGSQCLYTSECEWPFSGDRDTCRFYTSEG